MTKEDFLSVVPLFILTSSAILIMFSIAVRRNHKVIYAITALSLLGDFLYLKFYISKAVHLLEPLFIIDGFGAFYMGLILLTSLFVTMMSYAYFEQREERKEEYYILLILATLGACVLAICKHFISLFLGLEILSVALYAMITYLRKRALSDEAGIKYLILAAFSSAFLLFGMALVYAATGTMEFATIANALNTPVGNSMLFVAGLAFMLVGVFFKLSLVPFHLWAADVYQGAPAPVTAFIATVSKGGMMALVLRFFTALHPSHIPSMAMIFTVVAIASMIAGNVLALHQNNIKRILAYSSISHMGYLLVAFLAGGIAGREAVTFYLVAYFITTLGAFGILATLSDRDRDADELDDYRGLYWRRPWTAALLTAMLLSLAGIPLTAGFVGKFYVISAGVQASQWLLVVMLALNSVVGLYYYIRIITTMLDKGSEGNPIRSVLSPGIYVISSATLAVLALMLVGMGIYPSWLLDIIRSFL